MVNGALLIATLCGMFLLSSNCVLEKKYNIPLALDTSLFVCTFSFCPLYRVALKKDPLNGVSQKVSDISPLSVACTLKVWQEL